ncbi:MAG TPA: two-component regulator propeller domain-containing protein [Verrucomicrobiae bacterium]|nr:two-component regulator propeller domain-containing protein [Verrucomicrobiae bacterium]
MFTRFAGKFAMLLAGFSLAAAFPGIADETNASWLMRSWQTDEGLPDNSIAGLAQTPDGYIWIGTPSGLFRFDGIHFERFSLTNIIALPNRGIVTMMSGRAGSLWLAMDRGGVAHLNGDSSRGYREGLPHYIPNGIAEAADGTLLIAYRGGSVFEIHDGRVEELTSARGLPEGSDICAVTADTRGRIWFAKSGQVGIFEKGRLRTLVRLAARSMRLASSRDGCVWVCSGFHLFKCDDAAKLQDFGQFYPENSGTVPTVMLEDREGAVWIGTSFSGLFRRGQSGFALVPTTHQGILSLMEDIQGNIWAGTSGGGLNRIRRRTILLEGAGAGLPFSSVQSVCQDSNLDIWAVTQNGVLVHKKEGKREWEVVSLGNEPAQATCVAADSRNTVWVGARAHTTDVSAPGLYFRRNDRFVPWNGPGESQVGTIHTLLADPDGDLWMGQDSPAAVLQLHDGQIQIYPAPADSRIIRAMARDADGNIWAGTSKGILLRVEGNHLVDVTPRASQDLAPIRCLYATPDGALWIGYAGWGLGCLWKGRYTEINTGGGLYDDYISHIVADNNGWLWFGSNRGVFKVRIHDLKKFISGRSLQIQSVHYGRDEGLPSLQATFGDSPDVLRDHRGRLWIPMQTALVLADPEKQDTHRSPPPVLLTRMTVDERVMGRYLGVLPDSTNNNGAVTNLSPRSMNFFLPPNHRRVEFEFTALGFREPENIRFRYRLKGVDDDWVECGARRSASYARMPGGEYTFEVTACNNDGDWNPTAARLSLVVSPFFWQTWWFRLLTLAAFTAGVIAIVRYVSFRRLQRELRALAQLAALQKERARIAKDIHDDLGADLAQIAFMGELAQQDRADPEQVAARISKISSTARQAIKSLDEIVWAVNPRNDTLAHLLDYAGQFAINYLQVAGIRCRLDFPEETPSRELSTDLRHNLFLVIKEALHNIVKHARASEVRLRIAFFGERLEVEIEDNGCGFSHEPDDALADGLRNMRQRMTDIGGEFRVESRAGVGTKIELRLPLPIMDGEKSRRAIQKNSSRLERSSDCLNEDNRADCRKEN